MNISTIAIIVAVVAIFLFDYFIKKRKGISKISLSEDKSKFKKFENKVIRSSIIILLLLFLLSQFSFVIIDFFNNLYTNTFTTNTVVNNIELKEPMYTVDNDKAEELFNNLALSNNFTYDEFSNTLDDKKISLEILFDSIKKSDINNERFFFIEEFLNYFDSNANLEVPQIDYELLSGEDYKISIVKLSKQILINPSDDKLFFNRGRYKAALNNDFAAIDDFNEAIKLNPSEAEYYFRRGNVSYWYFWDSIGATIEIEYQYLNYKEHYLNEWENSRYGDRKRYIGMPGFTKPKDASDHLSIYGDYLLTSYDCINPDKTYLNYFLSEQRSLKALPARKGNRSYRYTPGTKTYYQKVVKVVNSLKSDAVTKSKYFYSAQKDFIKAFELQSDNFDIASRLADLYFVKREYSKSIKTLNKYLELTKDISNHASIYVSIADAYGAAGNLIKSCEFYSKSADLGNLEVYESKAFKNCN